MNNPKAWEHDFPIGYGHTSLAYLRRCIGFDDAKSGSLDAAHFVVSRCVKQDRLRALREQFPDAVLLPILGGLNRLPLALARTIGLPIWFRVRLLHSVSRKTLCAIDRLFHKPIFSGQVNMGTTYILVDDVITQGGTISALREFIMLRGGKVVAVVALAYAIGSHEVAPLKRHVVMLYVKFGSPLEVLLHSHGVATEFWDLTNSQAKYLLRYTSFRNIIKNMERTAAALTA